MAAGVRWPVTTVRIYFDYGSPFSFLAWQRVRQHPERYAGAKVQWVPVSAGHLFAADGTKPNASYPNQSRYTLADVQRWADAYGVAMVQPSSFPARTIEASRLHFGAAGQGPAAVDTWMAAVFEAHWVRGEDISDARVLTELVRQTGLPLGAEVVADPAVKEQLVSATKQAYDAGAPGVPYAVVDDGKAAPKGFWGNDRMAWVEAAVQGRVAPEVL